MSWIEIGAQVGGLPLDSAAMGAAANAAPQAGAGKSIWAEPNVLIGVVVWGYVSFETVRKATEFVNQMRATLIQDKSGAENEDDWLERRRLAFRRDWKAWNEATLAFMVLNTCGFALVSKSCLESNPWSTFGIIAGLYAALGLFGVVKFLGGYRESREYIRQRLAVLYCQERVAGHESRAIRVVTARSNSERRAFVDIHRYISVRGGRLQQEYLREERALLENAQAFYAGRETMQWFVAYAHDDPVGRIAVHKPNVQRDAGARSPVWFGFFESVNSARVARVLLEAALDWARGHEVDEIQGPFSWSMHGRSGILVRGFGDDTYPLVAANAHYYGAILDAAGARPMARGFSWRYWVSKFPSALGTRVESFRAEHPQVEAKQLSADDFVIASKTKRVYAILNDRLQGRLGFTHVDPATVRHLVCDLSPLLDPGLSFLIEDKSREAAEGQIQDLGVVLGMPNYLEMDAERTRSWAWILQRIRRWLLEYSSDPDKPRPGQADPSARFGHEVVVRITNRLVSPRKPAGKEHTVEDRSRRSARVMFVALSESAREGMRHLLPFVLHALHENARRAGYGKIELSLTLESDQQMNQSLILLGARPYKEFLYYRYSGRPADVAPSRFA